MVEQTTAAVHSLRAEAAELVRSIAGFSVGATGTGGGVGTARMAKAPLRVATTKQIASPVFQGRSALKIAAETDGWEEF